MDRTLIENWNNVVTHNDDVYILGDMFWVKSDEAIEILKKLNGRKHLIKGNHDRIHDNAYQRYFVEITHYKEIIVSGMDIVLCHYPILCYKNKDYDWIHLYGHVHMSRDYEPLNQAIEIMKKVAPIHMYNVGCMMPYMNYTPRTIEEILAANC